VAVVKKEKPASKSASFYVSTGGRNRTRSLYRSEPNTLSFMAYYSLILQGFKPIFYRSFTARRLPDYRPFTAV